MNGAVWARGSVGGSVRGSVGGSVLTWIPYPRVDVPGPGDGGGSVVPADLRGEWS